MIIKCFSVPFHRAVGNARTNYPQGIALLWLLLQSQQSRSAHFRRKCEGLAGWDSLLTMGVRQTHPFLHNVVLKRVMDPRAAIDNTQQKTKQKEIFDSGREAQQFVYLSNCP